MGMVRAARVSRRLLAELLLVSAAGVVLLRVAAGLYAPASRPPGSALASGVVVAWVVGFLAYGVWSRWRLGAAGPASLGVPNHITAFRGILFGVVAGFVVVPPAGYLAWVPAVCYGAGAAIDRLDGLAARRLGSVTELGGRFDQEVDVVGFAVAAAVAAAWGQLPVWYLLLPALKYVYEGAKYLRRARGRPVYDRPESDAGRVVAGWQMAFLTAALAPVTDPPRLAVVAPLALAPSVLVFLRDYLHVSGLLSGGTETTA
jgi:CDP-diacylglycerol--glycerol-3-phosphate 3-phosphatidyltransferase